VAESEGVPSNPPDHAEVFKELEEWGQQLRRIGFDPKDLRP
jgi:hypothetical protein